MIFGSLLLLLSFFLLISPAHLSSMLYVPTMESGATTTEAHHNSASNITPLRAIAIEGSPHELYRRVAARSLGEGSFALAEIACTIKNRLQVSGAPLTAVLQAYHAHDVMPAAQQVEIVRQIFEGELACPSTWWYALSLQDTHHWKPHAIPAVVIRRDSRSQVWIFHRR